VSERSITGSLLVLASLIGFVGVALFTANGRGAPISPQLFVLTRTFILSAAITTALGLALLEGVLRDAGERVLSRLGLMGFVLAAAMIVVAEATLIDGGVYAASLARIYVALAFLAQAAFGGALLRAHILSTWTGRATIAWNLGWLVLLLVIDPGGGPGYYPVLHYIMPLLIGIELVRHRPPSALT
jgi:hypothetical protein